MFTAHEAEGCQRGREMAGEFRTDGWPRERGINLSSPGFSFGMWEMVWTCNHQETGMISVWVRRRKWSSKVEEETDEKGNGTDQLVFPSAGAAEAYTVM